MKPPTINDQLRALIASSGCSIFLQADAHGFRWHAIQTHCNSVDEPMSQRDGTGTTPELAVASCQSAEYQPVKLTT